MTRVEQAPLNQSKAIDQNCFPTDPAKIGGFIIIFLIFFYGFVIQPLTSITVTKNIPFDIVPKDSFIESRFQEPTERFENRSRIRKFGCKYMPAIANFIQQNPNGKMMTIEKELKILSNFHTDIYNLREPVIPKKFQNSKICKIPKKRLSSIFIVNSPYEISICLPPKCGTTNWRKVRA